MKTRILIVVNKDNGKLDPSESFLHAHISGLPCEAISLIGNPGKRRLNSNKQKYLQSQTLASRGFRWLIRNSGISTVTNQDRRALANLLTNQKIDAVLAEYGPTAVSIMEACNDTNTPLIAHFHGWDAYSKYLLDLHKNDYKRLFSIATAIVAVSRHMKQQLIDLGAPPNKLFHNACGAEIPDHLVKSPKKEVYRYVMVGRLTEKKAPFVSIIAFSRAVNISSKIHLDIVGDGHLKGACQQLCKSLGIDKHVTFHGAKRHEETLKIMSRSHCLLQHSVTAPSGDKEGTPVGILEAMCLGLPIISTKHGGIIDVIENNVTGILVEEYDVNEMAIAMTKYQQNPAYSNKIGDAAQESALKHWTKEKSIDRLWHIIETAITQRAELMQNIHPPHTPKTLLGKSKTLIKEFLIRNRIVTRS